VESFTHSGYVEGGCSLPKTCENLIEEPTDTSSFDVYCSTVNMTTYHCSFPQYAWTYPEDKYWALNAPVCSEGLEQSPIDLPPMDTVLERTDLITMVNYTSQPSTGIDTGYSLNWNANSGSYGTFDLEGDQYDLIQFHLHAGSEHTVNGEQGVMELHLVHHSSATDSYAVIGVICDIAADPAYTDPFFDSLMNSFKSNAVVDPEAFLSKVWTNKYYSYPGSFTTPPCSEGVKWTVVADYCEMPMSFYDWKMGFASMAIQNHRDPQPLNDRTVITHEYTDWGYPSDNMLWGLISETCAIGKEQSPIELPALSLAKERTDLETMVNYMPERGIGEDTGRELKWLAEDGSFGTFAHPNGFTYELVQFHIHTAAEHTIEGVRHDLELHLVHYDATSHQYAVIGFMCQQESSTTTATGEFWNSLMETFEGFGTIDPTDLLKSVGSNKYYTYPGSFTVPPCGEGVAWTVVADTCVIPRVFWEWTQTFASMQNNYREIQPLYSRTVVYEDGNGRPWTYPSTPEGWGNVSSTCLLGKEQTPIDLPPMNTVQVRKDLKTMIKYPATGMGSATDTGIDINWSPSEGTTFGNFMHPNGINYDLIQFHIHTGSEHTIHGMRGDIEFHFVHKMGNNFAVIGLICEVDNFVVNPVFDNLMNRFGSPGQIDPSALFNDVSTDRYYTYNGSFTTPGCSEGVAWTVIADICPLPLNFYEWTQTFTSMKKNYREIQPLNDRQIIVQDNKKILNWGYPSTKEAWGQINQDCAIGRKQSPIDLPAFSSVFVRRNLVKNMQYEPQLTTGYDSGYSLDWMVSGDKYGSFLHPLNGVTYALRMFHIHTAAEHTIEDMRGDLEIHFVHSFENEDDEIEYAVVGIICEVDNFKKNTFFDDLISAFAGETMVNPLDLLNTVDTTKYYNYDGSFTIPGCTEGVKWTVIADICTVPRSFYEWSQNYDSMKNNYRELQDLFDREIVFEDQKSSSAASGGESISPFEGAVWTFAGFGALCAIYFLLKKFCNFKRDKFTTGGEEIEEI